MKLHDGATAQVPVNAEGNLMNWYQNKETVWNTLCPLYDYNIWFQPIWKNISQIGNPPQVGMKIENIWNHQPDIYIYTYTYIYVCMGLQISIAFAKLEFRVVIKSHSSASH